MTKGIISPIVKDNWILVDIHSGHTRNNSDDGVSDPETMVVAALKKGILPGFTGHNTLCGWQEYLKTLKLFNLQNLAIPSIEWGFTTREPQTGNKIMGELLTVIPPDPKLLTIMDSLSQKWSNSNNHNRQPIGNLWNYLSQNLSVKELRSLLIYYPHPKTIDQSFIGKMLLAFKEEPGARFIDPQLIPQNNIFQIHAVEVLNGGHPGMTNNLSYEVLQTTFPNAAPMASSDAHDPGWYGTAATLVKTKKLDTEGIFEGIKEKSTIPLSGIGNIKDTWLPFFLWAISSRKFTPGFIRNAISRLSNIQKPAHLALEKI